MSMLRYLSPGRGASRDGGASSPRMGNDAPALKLHLTNWGVIILPSPEVSEAERDQPRDDHVLHGELEVVSPGPRRCKRIRVGLRSIIRLNMGQGRKDEEDVLFERKVEILGASADGIFLSPGTQRFAFTIIIPSNLAPHDTHSNGKITHELYAELEGMPEPADWGLKNVGSSSSLFGMRKGGKRSPSSSSRTASPARNSGRWGSSSHTPSGASTPVTGGAPAAPLALAGALANLNVNASGHAAPTVSTRGATGSPGSPAPPSPATGGQQPLNPTINPAHLAADYSFTVTRQEVPFLPRTPSYDASMGGGGASLLAERAEQTPWVIGTHRDKRHVLIVYNPNVSGGTNELHDRASGAVAGLGRWEMTMLSEVWSVSSLMNLGVTIKDLPATTTVFAIRLALAQSWTIISPRDPGDGSPNRLSGTRYYAIYSNGKRPPVGHNYPDKHYPAIWRGTGAGGKHQPAPGKEGGEIKVADTVRLPTDEAVRPSTLPGTVTPINVSHNLVLEVFFSVFGEDDRGNPMRVPGPGGLRMLRVSRPVTLPSCALIPEVVELPPYDVAMLEKPAPDGDSIERLQKAGPMGDPGWAICACGRKLADMEARMRAAVAREAEGGSVAFVETAPLSSDKIWADRGRQGRQRSQ